MYSVTRAMIKANSIIKKGLRLEEYEMATPILSQSEMGMLSIYMKPTFMGLLKILNNINWFIIFFSLINLSVCIYEDQIGKFDWRQSYVGKIKFAQFDTVLTAKKIIVATEENVLAALHLKTGQVVWRHVFESTSSGDIQLLHVADKVVTVSGSNPYLVRGWDHNTGILVWEWSLTLQNDEHAQFSEWWVQQGLLVHMVPVFGSHIEITMYNLVNGQNRGSTSKLPAIWIQDGCVLSPPYYSCISGSLGSQLLISLDVTSNAVQIISKPLSQYVSSHSTSNLRNLDGKSITPGFVIDDKKIVLIKNNDFEVLNIGVRKESASVTIVESDSGPLLLQTWSDHKGFSLCAHVISTGQELPEVGWTERSLNVPEVVWTERSLNVPEVELSAVMCTKTSKEQHVCRILVTAGDSAAHLIHQGGRVIWTREEALANVVAAEFVDLPVSELDAAIESEFDQKEDSIWAAFLRRIQTQFQQLYTWIEALQKTSNSTENEQNALVRDYFDLHKIIVLVTDVGKIFGMDNLSGAILWRLYEPSLDTENVVVFTRRSARHPPHHAYLTVVGKHQETGNGLLISINPIRGTYVGENSMHLHVKLLQTTILHRPDAKRLHALILLDENENIWMLPESSSALVENTFMYVAERGTAKVQGYGIKYDGAKVIAQKTWSIYLGGGPDSGHRIVKVLGKSPNERVHSPGRVLADRSVLYKYSNPNLVLFITEGPDSLHKDVVVSACVDAVSGVVVTSQIHRKARALPLAVHTDNALAYLYFNDKHRRTEIATIELYSGKERWGGALSSLGTARAPLVERQAYVIVGTATAAATTATLRAITDTHMLLALSSGAIVEIPWGYLEPRRPVSPSPEQREEGLMPYAPELPLSADMVLNYNSTLHRVRALHTAPSGLESTSLVLATGLDLFYTRVAPSKTFDLLKDDFDYYLITLVLGALIAASYGTRYFASRKMLKLAWK